MIRLKLFYKVEKGVIVWERANYVSGLLKQQEADGGRYFAILEKEVEPKTAQQRGYFYGGIIKECMESNAFAGKTKREIEFELLMAACPEPRELIGKNGQVRIVYTPPDIASKNKEEMSKIIEACLAWLLLELDIYVRSPEEYYLSKGSGEIILD